MRKGCKNLKEKKKKRKNENRNYKNWKERWNGVDKLEGKNERWKEGKMVRKKERKEL